MCYACYEKAGAPHIVNDTTRQVMELGHEVLRLNPKGGNLRILFDDWALNKNDLMWCLRWVHDSSQTEYPKESIVAELAFAEAMWALTMLERASVMGMIHNFVEH